MRGGALGFFVGSTVLVPRQESKIRRQAAWMLDFRQRDDEDNNKTTRKTSRWVGVAILTRVPA